MYKITENQIYYPTKITTKSMSFLERKNNKLSNGIPNFEKKKRLLYDR